MSGLERTIVLVKAWPQPSQKYGETVCCAGPSGEWRRLFPIRFRHLAGEAQFTRWDVIEYRPEWPRDDSRSESRRIDEPTLGVVGKMRLAERQGFFDRLIRPSIAVAAERGESLTLVRPKSLRFRWKTKSGAELDRAAAVRAGALSQGSLLEKELAAIEPCPFDLRIQFEDAYGPHNMTCGDWETGATFFNLRKSYGDHGALEHLRTACEDRYARDGVVLALGTVKKRPKQWLMLGVIRLDETETPLLI